jgi:hypothetical protein
MISMVSSASKKSKKSKKSGKKKMKRLIGSKKLSKATAEQSSTESAEAKAAPPPPPPPIIDTAPSPPRHSFLTKQRARIAGRYIGFKEQAKSNQSKDERRGQVLSSLYTCMEDEEEDLLDSMLTKKPLPNIPTSRSA